jgi:hypothetical protein
MTIPELDKAETSPAAALWAAHNMIVNIRIVDAADLEWAQSVDEKVLAALSALASPPAQGDAAQPAAEGFVLVPRKPTGEHLRALFTMNSALPRTTEEAKAVYSALLNISEAQRAASPATSQEGGDQ